MNNLAFNLAKSIADDFAKSPQVEAVVLGGSQSGNVEDALSDIDLYIYSTAPIADETRRFIACRYDSNPSLFNTFWEPGDEWKDWESGIKADVMYRSCEWIGDQLDRVLTRFEASTGYTTCFWYNVLNSQPLFDRNGFYNRLQTRCKADYPEPLRKSIILKNFPILQDTPSSYVQQIESAFRRNDIVSINHRIAAFLASYFDILFAVNRKTHPGEKRLIQFTETNCLLLPECWKTDIMTLFSTRDESVLLVLNNMIDYLRKLLVKEGLI